MSLSSVVRVFGVGALFSGLAVACVVEHDHTYGGGGGGGGYVSPPPDSGTASTCPSTPSATPVLATIDTGRTMNANPGDGVGVFAEYAAGGHWHVWWTCDTNKTGASCAMDVSVTPATGALANVTADSTTDASGLVSTPQKLEAKTTTTTGVDGVRFDTDPGATITLSAAVGGCYDGSFLFFVQNGKVNGGFTGTLTDPVMLEGSAP